jgi:hypothetical protein
MYALPLQAFSQDGGMAILDKQKEIHLAPPPPDEDFARPAKPYKLNLPVDAAIVVPSTIWSIYAFPKIYSKESIDSNIVKNLKKEDIPAFDRWAVRSSDKASMQSDYLFYSAMPYPFLLLADKAIRKDALTVGALYWEAMAITGLLYTGGDYFIDRYRPETYDVDKDFGARQSGNEKNSFFAGHVALVATSTFFTASIYDEYHPASKFKWVLYGVAVAATGTTAYLRHVAGKHFPSDILVGAIVGVGSGMLVPRLHRNRSGNKHALMVMPQVGQGYGLAATYRF